MCICFNLLHLVVIPWPSLNATGAQVNIAWLLHRSPWLLPIPGTSSLLHFDENMKAADIKLTKEDMEFLG